MCGAEKGGLAMSAIDKARNKVEKLRGQAKETIGRATGDRNLENQGLGEQVKSDLKGAGEKIKDAFRGRGSGRGRGRGRGRREV
jgi:uncharacterized protein YjbJ (UPF0337 family)